MSEFAKITTNEYKELLDKVQFKTYFHETEWHKFLEKEFKWLKFEYYLYKNEAVLAFGRVGKKLISLPFCEYGGPLLLKEDLDFKQFENDTLNEFKDIKIKLHPQILSYEAKPRKDESLRGLASLISTHWIENLKNASEQELWDSFRKTLRHEIKKAQEWGLEIKASKDLKEIKRFYKLYVANLRRKKTIPYPWQIVQFLCQNPSNELLLAFYKGKIMGGSLFLGYDRFAHYFLSATDIGHKNLGSNYLILWEKIKSLINKDVILDLGATPKDSSLYTFKSGWGGKEYPIIVLENKKNLNDLRSSKLRNMFSLLPNFVIQRLSPWLIKYRL